MPFGLKKQIKELNLKIVTRLVNEIETELFARIRYIKYLETAKYMDRPLFVGAKGQRSLPSTLQTV